MRGVHGPTLPALAIAVTFAFGLFASAMVVQAQAPPSDLCALLPAGQVGKVLEQPFRAPVQSPAPRAFRDTAPGTECDYLSEKNLSWAGIPLKVIFTIYVESSAGAARDLFTKVRAFFDKGLGPSTAVGGVGDAAYRDSNLALHVLKGRAHYSINFIPMGTFTPKQEQQEKDLASWVAGQL